MSISILTSIALGGAIGAVARYSIDRLFSLILGPGILGILIVNISGSFLLGIISAIILEQDQWPAEVKLFTSVGILGSYTTFSTLMLTSTQLANNGDLWKALLNISASLIFGILATIFGIFLGKLFVQF
tara:strand:+ start:941 stop:1327 length:387 start_codon:yes stop_codon:yes gene_type:complete